MEGVRWAFRFGAWSPSRSEWLLAARCVQQEEKQRIGQFVFTKDAKAAMAGRLLMRRLVCEKVCLPWDGFRLDRTARGKPCLAEPSPGPGSAHWSFNVSHQGDYAVLAAEPGRQVGVDVMKTSRPGSSSVQEFFRIMTRQFTELEWRTIRSAGSDWDQLHMFYRHWALKESFIKAIGSGLGFDLQRVEFHISPNQLQEGRVYCQTRMHLDEEEEDSWTFEECLLDKHHHVAVALGKPEGSSSNDAEATPPTFTLLSFSELVSGATPLTDEDPAYWESFQSKQEAPVRQSETQ
ncbi:L-aminoadipate-semialdehyde dehydrogenase-phosphopantetheinyl transferase [Colossoma macropomum]|uniref:L-aminoadipate-semialdehyde dehydrogenase-phosphopantetheinyl transferase n=1 Tax=Colossoma macropomum TaxID=42526 RepID=UPI00186509D8|nr:L-aminoadipate-semialdehyde dehydrogenase-phosphopantetheinyl transferase [Colossoma macropomum]XP_036414021.1 L-aminoadipate-semialdehyde dehydrogenase-phosphopantetheinyl transferase [Colossoma macropomum]